MSKPHQESDQPAKQEDNKGEEETTEATCKDQILEKLTLLTSPTQEEFCIYKVPSKLRQVKEDAYNPRVVSIGPFHRDNHELVAVMGEDKLRFMLFFLQQTGNPDDFEKCLEDCTNAIYELEGKVRRAYAENLKYYKRNELTEIMLLDGCFILELFLRSDKQLNYCEDDLYNKGMFAALQHDLTLLENQIPFFVLQKLYGIVKPYVEKTCTPPKSVASLALKFFQPPSQKSIKEVPDTDDVKHLLDLLHKFYFIGELETGNNQASIDKKWGFDVFCGSKFLDCSINVNTEPGHQASIDNHQASIDNHQASIDNHQASIDKKWGLDVYCASKLLDWTTNVNKEQARIDKLWGFDYCASELLDRGVEFRSGSSDEDPLLKITYRKGVIRIPQLSIHKTSSSLFRNLIAYEVCTSNGTPDVMSYAFLMKNLITSSKDSELLEKNNIIKLNRINPPEYLEEFKNIPDEVLLNHDCHYDKKVCDPVNKYCKPTLLNYHKSKVFLKMRFKRDIKDLYHTYFSTTWSFFSFLAACVLLGLTSLQTYYAMNPK